ncbi:MAG: glycosyltransferase family 39 protein [Anaerolineales bacterium]
MSDIIRERSLKYKVIFSFLLLLSLLSGVIVFIATANGPLGYSDSVAYIVSARNLIKGVGLGMFTPSGRFVVTYLHPPLYPLLLSGFGILGVDLVNAVRWCNFVLTVLTVFSTGTIFIRYSRHPELSLVASGLMLAFPTILTMFMSAMSELLFLFLLSLSCLLLLRYFRAETKSRFILAAFVCGLLPVTRYVGIAVIIPAVVCILLFSSGVWQKRAQKAIGFGLISGIPLSIWLFILSLGSNRAFGGRSLQIDAEYLTKGFQTYRETVTDILWSWIPFSQRTMFQFLHPIRGLAMTIVFIIIVILIWRASHRLIRDDNNETFRSDMGLNIFWGIAFVSYFFVFMATWLFTVPQTPINERLLMPLYFTGIVWLLSSWEIWLHAWLSKVNGIVQIVPWLFAALLISWYVPQIDDVIQQTHKNDTVLSARWQNSQFIQAVEALPSGQAIVSNKSEIIAMWADRPAYDLMENLQLGFIKNSSPYGSDNTDSAQVAFRQGAALVVFNDFKDQFESTYGNRGKERLPTLFQGLTVVGEYPDGVIYLYSDK